MSSTGPALREAAEDMTVEVRDSRGIPYVQARVMALNAGEALSKASSAHPDTEWVFLRELSRDEIAQIVQVPDRGEVIGISEDLLKIYVRHLQLE